MNIVPWILNKKPAKTPGILWVSYGSNVKTPLCKFGQNHLRVLISLWFAEVSPAKSESCWSGEWPGLVAAPLAMLKWVQSASDRKQSILVFHTFRLKVWVWGRKDDTFSILLMEEIRLTSLFMGNLRGPPPPMPRLPPGNSRPYDQGFPWFISRISHVVIGSLGLPYHERTILTNMMDLVHWGVAWLGGGNSNEQWKKPWLFRVYRGLYYPVIWEL